ncbi:hypothetical protein AVDCRST_MAG81-4468 [uncultured Synechococcales cyanobacterium]|uniref:Uncharacterized protein n=1 Tax=uncultured Synechococcales cyanobacterium TaxID=1936017 RepID=A0A6J4VT15_9CYAN|nr:hypothetical protein AVDCRST_MAG81-4468 [uncultured Synechococcales cyanobacterium]
MACLTLEVQIILTSERCTPFTRNLLAFQFKPFWVCYFFLRTGLRIYLHRLDQRLYKLFSSISSYLVNSVAVLLEVFV